MENWNGCWSSGRLDALIILRLKKIAARVEQCWNTILTYLDSSRL
jgi:hypothetical protein